ncbi:MAG: adenylate/guanylate cyclase domain-containing protein [Chloroflexota bacterium]|nr:MAG: adenylate/guanylate cyclase domain-containing protein [Chloroflexota bacterium]
MSHGAPATEPGPGGTSAFLFSDIEGSTRLEQSVGTDNYAQLRERHRALVRAAITAHGGTEHGTEGDSFFVVFGTAIQAVRAALDAQRALAAEPWPDGGAVRVRMGINAGTATLAGGSLVGLAINRAARIAGVAHGGQVLASESIRLLSADALPEGASFLDLGAHRLKDLLEPEHLYQLLAPGLGATFPPLATLDAHPNNLPTQLTSFVGREEELTRAASLLASNRLVTLTGPGGTGKTRLSLQVAAAAATDYPDGVFFVPLETVRDAALVASRIGSEIGLAESGGRSGLEVLVEWLGGKKVLLVLDNFEQVVEAGPIVAELLRSAPALSILATSRAPLRVSGEQEYPVPGLPVPPDPGTRSGYDQVRMAGGGALDLEVLATYEAVRLFIARAVAVRPDFAVTNANAPAVAAICARLQGMPLAIELAAARIKLLSPDAILARLEHQLTLLAAGARDLPARQQTLRGAIAWSYDILDEADRLLLDRLSVFEGGFGLDAAEVIGMSPGEPAVDILDGLVALADQSLLRSVDMDPPRFVMLETIREFAAEMLDRRPEAAAVRARHTSWYLDLVEAAAPQLSGPDQRVLLERLELEHDNIRAVLDRAPLVGDGGCAIRVGFAMWRFWQKRGHLYEARRRLEAMAEAGWSHDDPVLRARLMEALGGVYWWQADIARMKEAYGEALAIWRTMGNKAEIANALYNFSFSFAVSPNPGLDPKDADPDGIGAAAQAEALALYEEIGDLRGQANVLWAMGNRAYFRQEDGNGRWHFSSALERFRQVGDVTMEAWSLHMLGSAVLRLGERDESRPVLLEALRHFYDASDASGLALVFDDLSSQAVADEDLPRAARLRGAARRLTAATGAELAGFVDEQLEFYARPKVAERLSAEEMARYTAEGQAMTLDESVAYALGITTDELASSAPAAGRRT